MFFIIIYYQGCELVAFNRIFFIFLNVYLIQHLIIVNLVGTRFIMSEFLYLNFDVQSYFRILSNEWGF